MLQEILDKFHDSLRYTEKRIVDLIYEVTVGLFNGYCEKTLALAKITATSYYVQAVKALREACVVIFAVIVAAAVFSLALVMTPMMIIVCSPWSSGVKMILILVVGVVFLTATGFLLARLFSEKKWMEFTRSRELLEKVIRENS